MPRKRRAFRAWLMRIIAPKTAAEREQFRVAMARGRRENLRLARSAQELEEFAKKRQS